MHVNTRRMSSAAELQAAAQKPLGVAAYPRSASRARERARRRRVVVAAPCHVVCYSRPGPAKSQSAVHTSRCDSPKENISKVVSSFGFDPVLQKHKLVK